MAKTIVGIIYKAENIHTGECYIGQTKKDLARRIYDHEYEALTGKQPINFILL